MKSGTTHLSELLGEHPSIFMSSPKEPCHFVDGKALRRMWPYMWQHGYWRRVDEYLSLFAEAVSAPVVGEASTVYSHAPIYSGVPARILAFNPDARFIYILRDPVERTISHYWHQVRWSSERRPMLTAIQSDPQYTDVSHYARQLKEYLRHVGLERIYVLTYEALLADTARELRRLYAWLGVDPDFAPHNAGVPTNERPDVIDQMRGFGVLDKVGLLDALRRTSVYINMAPYLPHAMRRLGAWLAVRSVRPDDVPVTAAQAYLRPLQRQQTEELAVLLNRSFPEWTTLYADAELRPARPFRSSSVAMHSGRNAVIRSR